MAGTAATARIASIDVRVWVAQTIDVCRSQVEKWVADGADLNAVDSTGSSLLLKALLV